MRNKQLFKSQSIAILLLLFFCKAPLITAQVETGVTVAVLDFRNASHDFSLERLENSVPGMLKTELSQSSYIQVLERNQLEGIYQELALSQTGLLDEAQAQKVGELAGAEYIIQGSFDRVPRGIRIDAHIIKVETGQIFGEKVDGFSQRSTDAMIRLLANNIIFHLTGNGTYHSENKLRTYPVTIGLLATAATGIAATVTHFSYKDQYDKYEKVSVLGEFDSHYDQANRYRNARNILLGATGVFAIVSTVFLIADQSPSNEVIAFHGSEKSTWALCPHYSKDIIGLNLTFRF